MPSEYRFEARNLSRFFGEGKSRVKAVDAVDFKIKDQAVVSIVGQSGCGKTVLAKMLLRLEEPSSGELLFDGKNIKENKDKREHWRSVQAIFQDPFSAFNQFFTIRSQLKSCIRLLKSKPSNDEAEKMVDEALLNVNIKPNEIAGKYPFELSGGQMQRMLIARIFILRPQVLIADEPTSMVDACSRASILDFLMKLKKELKMTIVFVTHDIGLACFISDTIFIMDRGKVVEQGDPDSVTLRPQSSITKQLLADIPDVHREWIKR